jgi:nucleolar protein 53
MPSKTGAPAQLSQSSRKGKKAWRKNVDIEDVEERMESNREEERLLGCAFILSFATLLMLSRRGPVHTKTNDQLFSVDTTGDDQGLSCL